MEITRSLARAASQQPLSYVEQGLWRKETSDGNGPGGVITAMPIVGGGRHGFRRIGVAIDRGSLHGCVQARWQYSGSARSYCPCS